MKEREMIQTRDAQIQDASVLDGMLAQLIQCEKQWDANLDENFVTEGNYSAMLEQEDCKLLVAEEAGQIIGYLCGFVLHQPGWLRPIAILDALFVSGQYRGRGCATALIEEFKKFAVQKGAAGIELKVFSDKTAANKLYTDLAFKERRKYMRLEL